MKISVIIPTLNEAESITACLESVRGQPGEMEVIVVDGGSRDSTVELARPYAAVVAGSRGRAAQLNRGAREAGGEVLLFLHADTRLHPAGLAGLTAALADPARVGGTFTLRFDRDHPLLRFYAAFSRLKFLYFHFGDQGIFVRRAVFERLGGFQEYPLMEDINFLERLSRLGRLALVNTPVTTSARRFNRRGLVRQQLLNVALVALYLVGVSPFRLARWYR